ncbi:uncharacterized protein AB675_5552 [Cyphellophora attinorum]|uniref:Uncharacterized protein n=1 Tax=Cyphellophora attinorum TaxID=1664694 RepID=A0A0N1H6Z0_9EURO|nr:uncharacterized protein AB675_5552 [Phialophora attinorum]KPI41997.1 hypothetical protein AB675_5552 [Phialophora attinorum]
MTPEDYERAQRKLTRYGHYFDMNLNSKLPADIVKTKAGKIAKRQPKYDERRKDYYQSQCSFRGLKTTGSKEELMNLLKSRDIRKDLAVQAEQDDIDKAMREFEREQKRVAREQRHVRDEAWWHAATTTFEQKLPKNPRRALEEEAAKPDTFLKTSCQKVDRGHYGTNSVRYYGLDRACFELGIAYEVAAGPVDLPEGAMPRRCEIFGELGAVRREVEAFVKEANQIAAAQWKTWEAQQKAKKVAEEAKRQALYDEAKSTADWDLTGEWVVQCQELATYSSKSTPEKLSMEIFLVDDFSLNAVAADEKESEYEYDGYGEEADNSEGDDNVPEAETATDSSLSRFCARFHFGVFEGIMRICPTAATRARAASGISSSIKYNPTYEYRTRMRGADGQILIEADRYPARGMKFSDHGTKLEGDFDCPYMKGLLHFTGFKVKHGHGRQGSSASEWTALSEEAWNRAHYTRWGRGWW